MRLKLSTTFRPARSQRLPNPLLTGACCGGLSKPIFKKHKIYDKLSLVSKLDDIDSSYIPIRRQKKFVRVGKIQNDLNGFLGVRRRRRFGRKRISVLKENQSPFPCDLDKISQWSVPLTRPEDEENALLNGDFIYLVRSHSQQNFQKFEDPPIFCLQSNVDSIDYYPQQRQVNKEEPHLNFYVENSRKNQSDEQSNPPHVGTNSDDDCIKDEDNLFDSLCQSGRVCSDNQGNDLLFCAEIHRSDIMCKAYSVFMEYYCQSKAESHFSRDTLCIEAETKWQALTQEERLPFLLQAYISDYMPSSVLR